MYFLWEKKKKLITGCGWKSFPQFSPLFLKSNFFSPPISFLDRTNISCKYLRMIDWNKWLGMNERASSFRVENEMRKRKFLVKKIIKSCNKFFLSTDTSAVFFRVIFHYLLKHVSLFLVLLGNTTPASTWETITWSSFSWKGRKTEANIINLDVVGITTRIIHVKPWESLEMRWKSSKDLFGCATKPHRIASVMK